MEKRKVVVTGANGHLGYNLVRLLVEQGYDVRAAVRDSENLEKTGPLRELGVELAEADVLNPRSLRLAMEGCQGLFHTAAVYSFSSRNPERDIIRPALVGTRNAMQAAADAGVSKVVMTSSIAAVGSVLEGEAPLTEADWNQEPITPYMTAKIDSEKEAIRLANELGLEFSAICPGSIIGPGFHRHTPGTWQFQLIKDGKLPAVPPFIIGYVDVRDVALAHLLAYEKPDAHERYIVCRSSHSFKEISVMLNRVDPTLNAPTRTLPASLCGALPLFDWFSQRFYNTPSLLGKDVVREFHKRSQRYDCSLAKSHLNWQPRDIHQSLKDTLSWVASR